MQEIAVLAAGIRAREHQFNAVADNVANVSTHGYRRLDTKFQELISRPRGAATASYVADRGLTMDNSQGGLETTGNPFDLAIHGPGMFAVQVNGQVQYTRKGQFIENSEGQVITPDGHLLLDNALAPIQLPTNANEFRVATDGTVSTEQGTIGQVGIFEFSAQDSAKLVRAGNTGFVAGKGAAPKVVEQADVRQGALEASNVNPMQEMVQMNDVSAAYQNSLKLLKGLEDMESQAIQAFGQTN
jgi:flagellar basal-body rod protein FlgF